MISIRKKSCAAKKKRKYQNPFLGIMRTSRKGFFLMFVIDIPVLMLANALITGWVVFSLSVLGCCMAAACINVWVLLIELGLSAFVIVIVKPLDAIRRRIPQKALYVLGILAYFINRKSEGIWL